MTKPTKPQKPKLPASGGSYAVQRDGALKQEAATQPKPPRTSAVQAAKKEA